MKGFRRVTVGRSNQPATIAVASGSENVILRIRHAVHDLPKGLAGVAYFGPKRGRHIVVEGQSGSRILLRWSGHHGVKHL
jgi:hypothetical protein